MKTYRKKSKRDKKYIRVEKGVFDPLVTTLVCGRQLCSGSYTVVLSELPSCVAGTTQLGSLDDTVV
jgi:hypothetical protein